MDVTTASTARTRRVLVVEFEPVVAEDIAAALREVDCSVVGPTTSAEEALQLVDSLQIDAAILDIRPHDEVALVVAERLRALGTPFLLTTVQETDALPEELRGVRVLAKPFDSKMLAQILIDLS